MAPSATSPGPPLAPPPKRRKTIEEAHDDEVVTIHPHPLRIKPLGNAFTASSNLRDTSLGSFVSLTDELLIQLLGHLDSPSLMKLGATSKGLYAFCRFEELWKDLLTRSPSHNPISSWKGTWRETYLYHDRTGTPPPSCIETPNLFSDVLYRPYYCSQIDLSKYTSRIPAQNAIPRLPDLTPEEFNSKWADRPFMLTSPVKAWPGYKTWIAESLVSEYRDIKFRAEAVDWPLEVYHQYMVCNQDESPLYLFDKAFVEKTNMGEGYDIPEIFREDFFEIFGEERPDRRWLILGPRGSGSTFHKDPNATSAWNAVLQGSKYWIMFPPTQNFSPPGVYVSADQSEVTSPLSIAEWLLGFHKEARRTKNCMEGICGPGEVLYVPSGWWHLVVNLDEALAITQNFVPRRHLPAAMRFLRDQPMSVSGFDCERVRDAYRLFVERMDRAYPEVLREAMVEMEKMAAPGVKKSGKWESLVEEAKTGGGFAFSFGGGDGEGSSEDEDVA